MAYVSPDVVYTVDFTGTKLAGLEVTVRGVDTDGLLDVGGKLAALGGDDDTEGAKKAVKELLTSFAGLIVSWNVEKPAGTPLPPTREGLGRLDLRQEVLPMLKMCLDAAYGVAENEELGKGSENTPQSAAVSELPVEVLSGNPTS